MNIQFYVSVTGAKTEKQIAKEVAEIVAYRDALRDAGIECDAPSNAPRIARSAALTAFSGDKSAECLELEKQWEELTGKGFRCSPEMALMFQLPDDRAGRIAKMIELVKAGKAVRGISGWMPASGNDKGKQSASEDDGEETF